MGECVLVKVFDSSPNLFLLDLSSQLLFLPSFELLQKIESILLVFCVSHPGEMFLVLDLLDLIFVVLLVSVHLKISSIILKLLITLEMIFQIIQT
jgi:hypothetical protein